MARYRKIDTRIWNDKKFRQLDDKAKLAFFLVLTHPNTNQLGMLRSRSAALSMELGWHPDAMSDAILTLCQMGMLMVDDKAGFIFIPNFLKYNPPNGPNAVKSWAGLIDLMPECDLLTLALVRLKSSIDGLSEGTANAVPDDIRHAIADAIKDAKRLTSSIQEQEQEQEQEINTNKHITNNEAAGASPSESSVENFDDSLETQADDLANAETQKVLDDPDAVVTPVQVIGLARMHGIKVYRTEKLTEACAKKVLTVDHIRQCIRIVKHEGKGGSYLVGIISNAVHEPRQYHTEEWKEAERKAWQDGIDENAVF